MARRFAWFALGLLAIAGTLAVRGCVDEAPLPTSERIAAITNDPSSTIDAGPAPPATRNVEARRDPIEIASTDEREGDTWIVVDGETRVPIQGARVHVLDGSIEGSVLRRLAEPHAVTDELGRCVLDPAIVEPGATVCAIASSGDGSPPRIGFDCGDRRIVVGGEGEVVVRIFGAPGIPHPEDRGASVALEPRMPPFTIPGAPPPSPGLPWPQRLASIFTLSTTGHEAVMSHVPVRPLEGDCAYDVLVRVDDGRIGRISDVTVRADETRVVDVVLGNAGSQVEGHVVDEEGAPLGRAVISLVLDVDAGPDSPLERIATADPDGSFVLPRLDPPRNTIRITAPGFGPRHFQVRWLDERGGRKREAPRLVLSPVAVIAGRVAFADGRPLPGVRLQAEPAEGRTTKRTMLAPANDGASVEFAHYFAVHARAESDDAGRFAIEGLDRGDWYVNADFPAPHDRWRRATSTRSRRVVTRTSSSSSRNGSCSRASRSPWSTNTASR
jgi:hypothetical protein